MNWAALIPFAIWLVQWIAGRVDAAERRKMSDALLALQFLREAEHDIANANAARAASERDAATGGLRDSDGYRRD